MLATGVKMKLTVVIPTYNEERIISKTIETVLDRLRHLPYDAELIISDDASKDRTVEIVKDLMQKYGKLRLLSHENNRGRGEVVSDAFLKSNSDVLMFMDADLSTDLKHIPEMIEYMKSYDIAIGSRWIKGSSSYRSKFRLFTSFLFNLMVRLLFSTEIHDHECGFKAFRRDVAHKLVQEARILEKNTRGVAWDTEILVRARRNDYRIKEFPVVWKEGEKSEIRILHEGIKSMKYFIRLRLSLWKD